MTYGEHTELSCDWPVVDLGSGVKSNTGSTTWVRPQLNELRVRIGLRVYGPGPGFWSFGFGVSCSRFSGFRRVQSSEFRVEEACVLVYGL